MEGETCNGRGVAAGVCVLHELVTVKAKLRTAQLLEHE